jgi:Skp family chaperone for outer membrane proteins
VGCVLVYHYQIGAVDRRVSDLVNATVLTTIMGLFITAIATIAFPMYLNRSKVKTTTAEQESVDSREVAKMFKDERDRLQLRLDTMQADYERRMSTLREESERALAAAKAAWQVQHETDQTQVAGLRDELQTLYRQLYRQPPSGP